jgi:hypothetical protein
MTIRLGRTHWEDVKLSPRNLPRPRICAFGCDVPVEAGDDVVAVAGVGVGHRACHDKADVDEQLERERRA